MSLKDLVLPSICYSINYGKNNLINKKEKTFKLKWTEFGYKPVYSSVLQISYVTKLKDNTCTLI